ncbi:MAG: septum formation protein Maf [Calditrichaeota bacterium]|nr:septum formation protein Maf [Calditrichota bacterium]
MTELCQLTGKKIILASQSPRRITILRELGLHFIVSPAQIDESITRYSDPVDYARQLAYRKGLVVWQREKADLVIAADTVVTIDHQILEKPRNQEEARQMLRQLSGRTHTVITALALFYSEGEILDHESTRVTFYPLTDPEIELYLQTEEPFDKAGAYAIQGGAAIFVQKIEGDFYNVVGFPVGKFYQHLKKIFLF